jgi:hypothetical protein
LGTGSPKNKPQYNANDAAKWGIWQWMVCHPAKAPLLEVFTEASNDMVDIQLSTLFQGLFSEENYLRIQVYIYIYIVIHTLNWIF